MLKARDRRKAMSEVMELRSFTILDKVFRDTPNTLAKSVIVMVKSSK